MSNSTIVSSVLRLELSPQVLQEWIFEGPSPSYYCPPNEAVTTEVKYDPVASLNQDNLSRIMECLEERNDNEVETHPH